MVMDHGRFGPQGVLGGKDGGVNFVQVEQNGEPYIPAHLSKDQNILVQTGDTIRVSTPGGGGYENPFLRIRILYGTMSKEATTLLKKRRNALVLC